MELAMIEDGLIQGFSGGGEDLCDESGRGATSGRLAFRPISGSSGTLPTIARALR